MKAPRECLSLGRQPAAIGDAGQSGGGVAASSATTTMIMLRRGEWARAWAAFLRVPPLRRSVYAASGGLTVGAALFS